ncbi:hypothetical protein TWF718_002758 [Orbilia javanica]|uniref:Spherulin-4 n=1 Tax=Orbilia javanica TaxID=47235 RepID=A0AAN8R804_9PEZI
MVVPSQTISSRAPASTQSSIHNERANRQQDLREVEDGRFSDAPKPRGDWIPEKTYHDNNSEHEQKGTEYIKVQADPKEISQHFDEYHYQHCQRCVRFRRWKYGLPGILGTIILLFGYLSFNATQSPHLSKTGASLATEKDLHITKKQPTVLQQRATSDQANIIIPAYFGPEDTASWKKVTSQITKFQNVLGFTIIINPSNGPGTTDEITRYSTLIESLAKFSNVNILGYIHQSWGNRDITGDVDTWISYFPSKLDGFFLDEMPSVKSDTNLSAVSSNNAYIKKKSSSYFRKHKSPLIVQNPGTEVDSSFYSLSYNQDVTIIFENQDTYLTEWIGLTRDSANQSTSSLGMIILTVSDSEMESAVKTMLGYSRYIFASGYAEAQAYNSIASNFGTFVKAAYKYGGTGSASKITTKAVKTTTTKISIATKTKSKAKSTKSTKRRFPTAAARRTQTSSLS